MGGAEARPAREVAVRAARGDHGRRARARRHQRGRPGPRCRRPVPGSPRPHRRQRRRLRVVGPEPHGDVHEHRHRRRCLHDPGRPRPRHLRPGERESDRALSRRRPAGVDLRDRAAGRRRGPGARAGPGGAPPAEPHPGLGDAVPDGAQGDLRQRTVRAGHGQGRPDGRRHGIPGPPRGVAPPREAPWTRRGERHRAGRVASARVRRDPLRCQRRRDAPDGHEEPGAGPRDGLQAGAPRAPGARSAGGPLRRRRHRPGRVRHGDLRVTVGGDRRLGAVARG